MLLQSLKNKIIFLTGGTGFFGKSILDMLKKGFLPDTEFVFLSRNPQHIWDSYPEFTEIDRVRFVAGDARSFEFPDEKFDYIIHAATPAVTTLQSDEMYSIIVDGTKHVLEMCETKKIKRLLYISSGAVYGIQPPDLLNIPEDYPCKPVTVYGRGKLEAENLCLSGQTDVVISRCFTFVGPYLPLDKHYVIGNFINNILNGEDINILGNGTPYRAYMYADDLVEWLFTILLKGKSADAYNVGSNKAISIAELAKLIGKYSSNKNIQVSIAKKNNDGIALERYIPSVEKARKELGLKCKTSLENAIQKTISGIKNG